MLEVLASAAAILLLGGQPAPARACPSTSGSLDQLLLDGESLETNNDTAAATACFALAAERASAAGNQDGEARARVALARSSTDLAAYARAATEAQRARDLFEARGDRLGVARADVLIGAAAAYSGQRSEATAQYVRAIGTLRELRADADLASALIGYTVAADLPAVEEIAILDEAIGIARRLKLRAIEGRALHTRADHLFALGQFDAALRDLSTAIDLLQSENRLSDLANAYVSMGRIHRAHGQPEAAIGFYDQAAAIQEQIGDLRGLVQSTNSKAIALAILDRPAESRATYERALEIAKKTGVPRIINFQQGNLAAAYASAGDYAEAIRLLEEVIGRETDPYVLAYRHVGLALDYLAVKQLARALDHADQAVKLADQTNNRELLATALLGRARILRALGELDRAVTDAAASTRLVEDMRGRLVPLDFMKRGFSEHNQEIFGVTISLLHARGDNGAALVASEQARARAFLDLLATRSLVERGATPTTLAVPKATAAKEDVSLASFAAAAAATSDDIARIAARLRSTIVAYWVDTDELFIWVVAPGAPVHCTRVAVSRRDLERTVTASLPTPASANLEALRKLYRWLIEPVERWLPPGGSTLTVVPHGPLFRVSFAALRNARGGYLIERYAIGYSPSISAFIFTERLASAAHKLPSSYLLVADPRPQPQGMDAPSVESLPASLREARDIRQTLGVSASSLVLSGTRASEPLVRDAMAGRRIIHLATHAFVSDDDPFESFLGLGVSGTSAASDGRLTVRELYDLDLHAELVILSACRTATGRMSGEGIAGVSRAFFAAGAASVVATQWDVADEPSARLMALFYRNWRGTADKRRALRDAQLEMIRELRQGSLSVRTDLGTVRLLEQPFNWAGYQLFGEP